MQIKKELFNLPSSEIKLYGKQNLIYGSLTKKGINNLAKLINKYMMNLYKKQDIYGIDLGCGDGELIYQFGKLIPESKWEGVEISQHRVDLVKHDINIWQGDMLEENLRNYNVIHVDNLCFDDELSNKLEQKIINEFNGLLITYKEPINENFLSKVQLLESVTMEASWGICNVIFYKV
jgi:hypothetical protein